MKQIITIVLILISTQLIFAQDTIEINNPKKLNSIYIQNQSALIAIDYDRQISFNKHLGVFLKGGVGVLPFIVYGQLHLFPLAETNLFYKFNDRHFIEGGAGVVFLMLDLGNVPYANLEYRFCSRKGFLFKAGLQYYGGFEILSPTVGIGYSF